MAWNSVVLVLTEHSMPINILLDMSLCITGLLPRQCWIHAPCQCCLCLQEKKQLVFEGTVGKDAEALGRLTEDDLRFLFG